MDTYFAPAGRASDDEFRKEVDFISNNAIVSALLQSVSGLLAVLNEQRQILAVNQVMLDMLGVDNPGEVLGLRPGEALKCVHACEMPGGCGTSEYCSTCGAALSIVSSLATDGPVERECALTVTSEDRVRDLFFRVRCVPTRHDSLRVLMLFLQDITHEQRLAALERTFFHDINGIIQGLIAGSEVMKKQTSDKDLVEVAQIVQRLSQRLANEVAVQRCLSQPDDYVFQPMLGMVTTREVFEELRDLFSNHPAAAGRSLVFPGEMLLTSFKTELSLLIRVLGNMITNALEASGEGDEIRVWADASRGKVTFSIWNRQAIPVDIQKRIFQRNFSTKSEFGRGLGTYSMKLTGERFLGGKVDFLSSAEGGTVFQISLPEQKEPQK